MTERDRAEIPGNPVFNVWEGIFPTYAQALLSAGGEGFASDAWVERTRQRLREVIRGPEEALLATPAYLLPVAAALLVPANRPLRVLDFGGGPGTGFLSLVTAKGLPSDIEYHVVDNERIIALAREMIGGDARLILHSSLPEAFAADIVHLGSCIQYIDDLDELLARLKAFQPTALLFSDVFAGDIEGFWTLQNLWGSRVPFHFMCERDFIEIVEKHAFQLRLRVPYIATILGRRDVLPMDNFPQDRRIMRASHYLFVAA